MAAYDTGYEDERFQHPVGHTLHCGVCMNVLKDPVMCRRNEHLCCRVCITTHLKNSQTCPTCMEPLTVETLNQAPRGIRSLLAELKIRCEFYDRGCREFIELENLESHLRDCGFSPAVCSNEGCRLEVNQRDLLHHETVVCELRRVQCHSCNDIKQEMEAMKVRLATMDEKLEAVELNVQAKIDEQIGEQEESNLRLDTEVKKCFKEITKLGKIVQTLPEALAEQMKKGTAEAGAMKRVPKVVIAGGKNESGYLKSVENYNVSNKTWTDLQPLREGRQGLSSVVHNDKVVLSGGYVSNGGTKCIQTLSLNAVHVNQSITWKMFDAELPTPLWGHCSVVYKGSLIVIGGHDDQESISDSITEIPFVSPYASKLLATMPQARWYHCVTIYDDKIVIVGGVQGLKRSKTTNLKIVLLYDITKNEFEELAPLPYAVSEAAITKWGDDNVIILGGVDNNSRPLNKVLLYNIKTQKSHELPDMKYRRKGCVAAVVRDTVIVMGGKDEEGNILKSVESFRFDRYSWQDLPDMHEGRYCATAVVC